MSSARHSWTQHFRIPAAVTGRRRSTIDQPQHLSQAYPSLESGILIDKTLVDKSAWQTPAIVRLDGFEVSNAYLGPSGHGGQIQLFSSRAPRSTFPTDSIQIAFQLTVIIQQSGDTIPRCNGFGRGGNVESPRSFEILLAITYAAAV